MTDQALAVLREQVLPLRTDDDLDAVLSNIGQARLVLMGEATHGTREFYQLRAALSKRLIVEHGFDAIAVEADWPDALQASRFVQLKGADQSADQALSGFQRFPQWMWRNEEMVELLYWLRLHNQQVREPARRIGFYGLDLYSLHQSMRLVVRYLEQADPSAAGRARERYSCIDHVGADPLRYGYLASLGLREDCEKEVVRQLAELTAQAQRHLDVAGGAVPDELFYAQQNARVVQNAERYYRAMFSRRDESWNVRDSHMADTLDALLAHLSAHRSGPARLVVWAHNSHLGDARATEMGRGGQLNLGQLARERHGEAAVYLLGFSTHDGTVTAASEWDGPAQLKRVRPSLPGSLEALLHQVTEEDPARLARFLLPLRACADARAALPATLLERAIGVVYRPETERQSHYFDAEVARQFDAVIHADCSNAVKPLELSAHWRLDELPETYPSGL
ncbi:erythromycin esterase family protein [Duganella sp. BJB1802]|uniref:erythromycin esterase family protein n=1 Tax=Duganella sp. BJB1802 TaxID=2744575 RepID=UPI0015940CA5|nr:erythromycin esterase family protein [Duganella sp. BJB1802]NVD74142.1 erythromycin esterase family protein [Duganella sp. BJB1802]